MLWSFNLEALHVAYLQLAIKLCAVFVLFLLYVCCFYTTMSECMLFYGPK